MESTGWQTRNVIFAHVQIQNLKLTCKRATWPMLVDKRETEMTSVFVFIYVILDCYLKNGENSIMVEMIWGKVWVGVANAQNLSFKSINMFT